MTMYELTDPAAINALEKNADLIETGH